MSCAEFEHRHSGAHISADVAGASRPESSPRVSEILSYVTELVKPAASGLAQETKRFEHEERHFTSHRKNGDQ